MLISKTVKMKWHGSNKKYFQTKGYTFTKIGDEFEVKVDDLSYGSTVSVEVKCDGEYCDKNVIRCVKWQNYLKNIDFNGKYYCHRCSMNHHGEHKKIETWLKNSMSFYNWCIEKNRQDILDRWDYELNNCKPSEITYRSKKNIWLKCPKTLHDSEPKFVNSITQGFEGRVSCKTCNSFGQYLLDKFGQDGINQYWSKNNTLNPFNISKSSGKSVKILCAENKTHDCYEITCGNFYMGWRCPYCSKNSGKVHPLDSLGQYMINTNKINLWSDKNDKSPFNYSCVSGKNVWWKCSNEKHSDYQRNIASSKMYEFRCPACSNERKESFLQEKVRLYLESLQYTILHETNCTIIPRNPKTNHYMPFDNEIKQLKCLIEVHGTQHYKITGFHFLQAEHTNTTPEYELHMQQVRDRYKRICAKLNGYYYLEIPYWTDDENETWKGLINAQVINISKKEKQ